MRYARIEDVPVGSIGLTSIKGRVGFLIRVGQFLNGDGFSRYEHAFVLIGGISEGIVEAEPGGAPLVPFHYDIGRCEWLTPPTVALGQATAVQALALRGTPYSFLDYLYLAAWRLRIRPARLRDRVRDSGHQICSQLADTAAANAGWHLFDDGRLPQNVTPGDLWRLVRGE